MILKFRTINESDLEMILRWRTLPEVSKYMYTDFESDMEKQRAWYRTIAEDQSRYDWVIQVDGEDVGLLSIVRIDQQNRRCEWAYYLGSESVRGKGIGRAVELNVLRFVFDELQLNKLCCEVFVFNDVVVRIHEKFGSVVEGTRRSHIWKNGEFMDIVEMGILRADYERRIKGQFEFVPAVIEHTRKGGNRG